MSFTSSLPIWMPILFLVFFLTIAMARTSNESGEREHPCLVPDLYYIEVCALFNLFIYRGREGKRVGK